MLGSKIMGWEMKLRALLLAGLIATPAQAAVTSLTVVKTTALPGGYELLEGHFSGALVPNDPHNAVINDIKLAPKNAAGRVEYTATFAIARPIGSTSGVLVYDVSNRGRGAATAIGDGHINVLSGWQGDLDERPGVQRIDVPSAPVTGPAYVRFMDMPAGTSTMPVKGGPQGVYGGRTFEVATADGRDFTPASQMTGRWSRRKCPKATGPLPIAAAHRSPASQI